MIFHGVRKNEINFDLNRLAAQMAGRLEYMHGLEADDIIDFFGELSRQWGSSGMLKKYPYLKNISDFLDKKKLARSLDIALHGSRLSLDKLIDLGDDKLLFHAQPRGITAHWIAGNTPVLGLFSIFSALLTKNVCLVKAPRGAYEDLIYFLDAMNEVETPAISGRDFGHSVAVFLADAEDRSSHEALSEIADVRIAWGGYEAIDAIVGLKKKMFCEDIIFGPKYSYAAIDKESLLKHGHALAGRLSVDISVFDQSACSSPHIVFAQEAKEGDAAAFAEMLSLELERASRLFMPKGPVGSETAAAIVGARNKYALKGKVFKSKGTEWTVIYTNEPGLGERVGSRVVFVKPIKDFNELKDFNDRQKQTLGLGFTAENKLKYVDALTVKGIDRCPELGYLTFYESPWDGMFLFDRLVRWVTTHKSN